jgi:hypothetical protein
MLWAGQCLTDADVLGQWLGEPLAAEVVWLGSIEKEAAMRLRNPTRLLASTALILASCVIAACSSGGTTTGTGRTHSAGPSPSQSASPARFLSPEYGYSVTLPAGWNATQAFSKWDSKTELSKDSFDVDRFIGPSSQISFAAAAGWTHGLASFARYLIASTVRFHLDTCPRRPDKQGDITIGGRPGVLLEYNCGILINMAETVRHRVGYVFVFRDDSVQAASDPTDDAVFAQMLRSVELPR